VCKIIYYLLNATLISQLYRKNMLQIAKWTWSCIRFQFVRGKQIVEMLADCWGINKLCHIRIMHLIMNEWNGLFCICNIFCCCCGKLAEFSSALCNFLMDTDVSALDTDIIALTLHSHHNIGAPTCYVGVNLHLWLHSSIISSTQKGFYDAVMVT